MDTPKRVVKNIKIHELVVFMFILLPLMTGAQQTISGNFPLLANQKIKLHGFEGFTDYVIDSVKVSEKGRFLLSFNTKDHGMGYLKTENNNAFIIILVDEKICLQGEFLNIPETVKIHSGKQNQLFAKYATEYPQREQALSAWDYLEKMYQTDSLFKDQSYPKQAIEKEIWRIKQEDNDFLKGLDSKSYLSWYLPTRKLLSSVATIAQYRTEEIPAKLEAIREMDYTDQRLHRSGLLKDAIENHFWLIENMGKPMDSVYAEMVVSIDIMLANLSKNEKKFNLITKFLFELLEQRSLFKASEYLAVKILTQNSCTISDNLAKQLESYRAMKKGNSAPDIVFSGEVCKNGSVIKTPNRLSEIQSEYKVVIFGASWCPKCAEELSQLLHHYEKWKSKDVEVIFISLDTEKSIFRNFSTIFPFISMCDYKKWDTQAVKDYYVFATPTLFLLDQNQQIMLRPGSIVQVDAWVDYYLGEIIE